MGSKDLLEALEAARIFDLEQLRYAGAPSHPAHAPGFSYFLHRHHARGAGEARTGASGIVLMPEHSGTHIDALASGAEPQYRVIKNAPRDVGRDELESLFTAALHYW